MPRRGKPREGCRKDPLELPRPTGGRNPKTHGFDAKPCQKAGCAKNPSFSPPSNAHSAKKMAFRRRRIQVLPAKCQSDGVESAFRRQNGDPTRSNQRFPGKMAIRRAGEARFFGRMPIRRGGIGIFLTECRFDGGGSGVFLAEGRFDGGGSGVFLAEGRFDRGERAFRWRKGGPARRGVTFRRVEAGSPPGQWRPPLQTGFPHRGKRGLDGGRRFITASRRWFCRERAQRAQRNR